MLKYNNDEIKEKIKEHLKDYLEEKGVKFKGNYFKCFMHDDKNESAMLLSDGKGFKCFKCNFVKKDIFDAYAYFEGEQNFNKILNNLTEKYLSPTSTKLLNNNFKQFNKNLSNQNLKRNDIQHKGKLEKEYIYVNEYGKEVFKIQRYQKLDGNNKVIMNSKGKKEKYFVAYKKDGKQWEKGIQGVCRYWYNLTKVKEAIKNDEIIIIVEGEKSCDIINKNLNLCATTTPFGSNGFNNKFIQDFKDQIKGAKVVLIPDNDAPGYRYMETVKEHLKSVTKSMKIIKLVDDVNLEEGADIEEWLNSGGSKERLLKLIGEAEEIIKPL